MPITLGNTRDRLVAGDPELQHLAAEHSRYQERLQQLSISPYRSAEDILLEVDLKKQKLRVKDEMEKRMARLPGEDSVH